MVDSNLAFIDPVSAVYYGGSGWLYAYHIAPDKAAYCVFTQLLGPQNAI